MYVCKTMYIYVSQVGSMFHICRYTVDFRLLEPSWKIEKKVRVIEEFEANNRR